MKITIISELTKSNTQNYQKQSTLTINQLITFHQIFAGSQCINFYKL